MSLRARRRRRSAGAPGPGQDPRRLAVTALTRIDAEGAYANVLVPKLLAASGLDERDRAFLTELVYGTCRMRRACDWLVDRFLVRAVEPEVRAVLRLGAYQLAFSATPPHAAVAATVEIAPRRARGLVNAVLRRAAEALPEHEDDWPDLATRLSYPDWIVERLVADLGPNVAVRNLARMNERPPVTVRADGYVQDPASQWVAEAVAAQPAERVADVCAAPGGKATGMAKSGATIVASDLRPVRARLVAANARALGASVTVVAADATRPPWAPATFDRVLVDAPCSGLGALRRRPDARWRIEPGAVDRLAHLQRRLVEASADLVRSGGLVVYSACTVTAAETTDLDAELAVRRPDLDDEPPPGPPWTPLGRGARVLPADTDTDGMYLLRLRRH